MSYTFRLLKEFYVLLHVKLDETKAQL